MNLEQLLALLNEKSAALETIKTKALGADATAADATTLEKVLDEIETLQGKIDLAKRAEATQAKLAKPAAAVIEGGHQRPEPQVKSLDGVSKVGLLGVAIAAVKRGHYTNPLECLEQEGYGQVAKEFGDYNTKRRRDELFVKSLNAGSAVSGGVLVPVNMEREIIELLRPQTAFLAGNPRRVPMPNGTFVQAGGATGASASYGTELSNAAATEGTFRDIEMVAKELKALVPISNQFLDFSIESARSFVETDLRNAMSEKMDNAAFLGNGLTGNPLGLYNISGIGTRAATNSTTPTIANVDSDLRKAINGMRNLPRGSAKWIMDEVTFGYLQDLRDGNGNPAYPSLQNANPTLKGFPVLRSTNLPNNLGGGGNETYLGLVAFDHVLFGEAMGLELAVSTEAAYYDAGGTVRSAFQRGETLLLAIMRHDFGLRHLRAVQLLTAVKYGG